MKQILIRSWKTKVPRFDLVQAVSAIKSLRVWRQVHPVYIGSRILYDEGKWQRKKTFVLLILFYSIIPLGSLDILAPLKLSDTLTYPLTSEF